MTRGQVVLPIVVALVILATLIAAMVTWVQREAVWTAKQTRNTTAFHLAEAGQEKGFLALSLSTSVWSSLQNGNLQTGYKFDVSYTDLAGGSYTIYMSSGPGASEVQIISVGRDSLNRELRAIKTVYSASGVSAAMYAASVSITFNNTTVDWGPVESLGTITFTSNNTLQCSPQVYAVGAIVDSGASNNCTTCVAPYAGSDIRCTNASWANNSSSPCTDGVSWWSNNCSPGVPSPPTIDLATYKQLAQADHCPTAQGFPLGANPANSCYWPAGTTPTFGSNGFAPASTHTYYTDDATGFQVTANNEFLQGAMIAASSTGGLSWTKNTGAGSYTIPDWLTPTGIPPTAWKQYQLIDTAASNEYFGDAGYQKVSSSFTFGCGGCGANISLGTNNTVAFRGFVYLGGGGLNVGSNNVVFHGVVYSPGGVSGINKNNTMFFYDADTAAAVKTTGGTPSRISWQDVVFTHWPGP